MTHPTDFENPLCAEIGGDMWFAEGKGETYPPQARQICAQCTHRIECASYAIQFYNLDGMWGGTTPRQRANIRRQTGIRGRSIMETEQ